MHTGGSVSLPEFARIVPALASYDLHPDLDIKADGPADRLALDLNVTSRAGKVRGSFDMLDPAKVAELKTLVQELLAETPPAEKAS